MSGAVAGERRPGWLQAGVITEHDGSITAVIRHQTKGTSRAGRRGRGGEGGGEDGPRHSCSVTRPPDEVSAPEQGREVNTSAALEDSYRLQRRIHRKTVKAKAVCTHIWFFCWVFLGCFFSLSLHLL